MSLRPLYRRLRGLVTGRPIHTATFTPSDAHLYDLLLAIDPRAAALFAKSYGVNPQRNKKD